MDPKGLLSLSFLLFLSLAFELSYQTGGGMMNCPKIFQPLGSDTWLPLTYERINKSTNRSIRILVTKATSPSSSIKKKIVSLDLPEGGTLDYQENGYLFHWENLSLRILGSRKEREGWYFMSLEENVSVQHFCVQLKLYEQVSTPEIKVLNRAWENRTCSLILACTVEKGDHVTYSWSDEAGTHLPSPHNSSHLLNITVGPQRNGSIYRCNASNPVSSRSQTFNLQHELSFDNFFSESRPWILYAAVLVLAGITIITPILTAMIMLRRRGKENHCQPIVEDKGLTIYAQVQKSSPLEMKPDDALSDQDPCTTIYVDAIEPVPEPVQESKPITVYANVTLPES
ncbi:signaling lymphocytic activation molecule isoform X1 [Nannospalax galili]|uniref:signaling lymphocytic activation molecule isoform X1 n=1 Tax=Nannospalax galili TaxID=1026970 RepID=UPI00111BFA2A|nr:signaling lymphocytic activation molecule isoform X1 [Nannospalax galili]